jgi:hypothetical protein
MVRPHLKFFADTENGELIYHDKKLFDSMIRNMGNKKVEVVVKPVSKPTSLSQHGYYRGVILEACFESEMFSHYDNPDQIHEEYFKPRFLRFTKMIQNPHGGKSEVVLYRSMSDMDNEETSKFIDRVITECGVLGISFRSAEEYWSKIHK